MATIRMTRSGGVTGMKLDRTVQTENLPPAEAAKVEDLLKAADLDALPGSSPAPEQARDMFHYYLTIEWRGKTYEFDLGQVPGQLQPIIDYIIRGR